MDSETKSIKAYGALAGRGLFGGLLMGLANLVPGISGGTMLLAAGVYPNFIAGIAEVTRLKFRGSSLIVLGSVVGAAMVSILLFAGVIKDLVVDYRWVMYSIFIGLTLGGVPVVKNLAGKRTNTPFWGAAVVGFLAMALLAWAQTQGLGAGGDGGGIVLMFVAGLVAASAMILPGLSGGYLLLVMGAYIPILSGIEGLKDGLKTGSLDALMAPTLGVVLPVGIGVVLGVALVSNVLQWALEKHALPTLGSLMGLLVGAVVGLWPFQHAVEPVVGLVVKGRALTTETLALVEAEDLPTVFFTPGVAQVLGAIVLIVLGFGFTYGISRMGGASKEEPAV